MKNKILLVLLFILLCSHDMYLKMETYFLKPNQDAIINLYNGTFEKSENVIDRDRMLDVSLIGSGERISLDEDHWSEKDSITILNFKTGNEGTWVAGVSTKPREIAMEADAFNNYLEHDGVLDMLESRRENNTIDQNTVERYSKHVKAIFQVGDKKSKDWSTVLGYPIEFVPKSNPYDAKTGDSIQVLLLRDGAPLSNQLIYANFKPTSHGHTHDHQEAHSHVDEQAHTHGDESHSHANNNTQAHSHTHEQQQESHSHEDDAEAHSHSHGNENSSHTHGNSSEEKKNNTSLEETEAHVHTSGTKLRTDNNGIINVKLTADGIWYLRTIHLIENNESGLTHESNWATLTFEVQHGHDSDGHTHSKDTHTHEESNIPNYVYWIGSILVIGLLFFMFNRKK
ncbi:DUF4198 domain-containing protein [Psychroserpens sp. Hel_I_66]|uniref:DUF4198 domain-containing protein n=1 Tax=Psychroserpens sp. Hel_I_66 TaxID=1250004 RepID=UPI0006456123|nr:DUF4198 domain-containing protein [Psychroserpens sp. Hel_I_66]